MEGLSKDSIRNQRDVLVLPPWKKAHWRDALPTLLNKINPGLIEIDCRDWILGHRELSELMTELKQAGFKVSKVKACIPQTIVSASALGHITELILPTTEVTPAKRASFQRPENKQPKLLFHQGTLHSGDHLDTDGDLMLLGDVNPGARISAGGDVMIWGRLRGFAHAGKDGNSESKIMALHLRPLQLRIAHAVARGPEDQPQAGLAEQARLIDGIIVIEPAITARHPIK